MHDKSSKKSPGDLSKVIHRSGRVNHKKENPRSQITEAFVWWYTFYADERTKFLRKHTIGLAVIAIFDSIGVRRILPEMKNQFEALSPPFVV